MSDPRVFFAAERTLLAWIRTGITAIALGFVVARFGLFLRVLSIQGDSAGLAQSSPATSTYLGVLLCLLGTCVILTALAQHRAFVSSLSAEDLPPRYRPWVLMVLTLTMASCGVFLTIYLAQ